MKEQTPSSIGMDMATKLFPLLAEQRRILLWGEMGSGKSTLALRLLSALGTAGKSCYLFVLDPGSPPGGVPGTVGRAWWDGKAVQWGDFEGMCSFDAARFRLPLLQAADRLLRRSGKEMTASTILIDPPGITRGVAGAEFLVALVQMLRVDCIVALHEDGEKRPLAAEMASLPVKIIAIEPHQGARSLGKIERAKQRTILWDSFLKHGEDICLEPGRVSVLGTAPPVSAPAAWVGRQVALLDRSGATLAMGEVTGFDGVKLTGRVVWQRGGEGEIVALLLRDAGRTAGGMMGTIPPVRPAAFVRHQPEEKSVHILPATAGHSVTSHVGPAWATLIGGVFADPLLHVRLRQQRTSLFFDLGGSVRPTTKIAHQVSSVFLSHCHLDHIGGFLWFLRARIGEFPPCDVYGPPETISRLENFIEAIVWDRIEESGPVFIVNEIGSTRLRRARLQPGKQPQFLPDRRLDENVILAENEYCVKACVLDHHIPSVAYALVFHNEIKIKKNRLEEYGLTPGRWLGRLKKAVGAGDEEAEIELPDGTWRKAGKLTSELLIVEPGHKLVYATDFADTRENREKVIELADGAHTLFCEAAFADADRDKARDTQHLTTRAAVEIAMNAGVGRLVPFHFSKRYEHNLEQLYAEMRSMAGRVDVMCWKKIERG